MMNGTGIWRSVLVGGAMVIAIASLPCADDLFQSAPGPAPRPHATRPQPKPETPQPVSQPAVAASAPSAGIAVFDGRYKGGVPDVADCLATMGEVDVSQGKVNGIGSNTRPQRWLVLGTVSGDGSFTGTHGVNVLTGKFHDGVFEGSYLSSAPRCGRRTLTLRRDAPQ